MATGEFDGENELRRAQETFNRAAKAVYSIPKPMGLDGVELILAIEETFQIAISDTEAESATTVGALYRLVVAKLEQQDAQRCLTTVAFNRTRRGLQQVTAIARKEIRPSTPLESILPRRGRPRQWLRLQGAMSLKLPPLQHAASVHWSLIAVAVITAVGTGCYLGATFAWLAVLVVVGLVGGVILIPSLPWLAFSFPGRSTTVGDLARCVVSLNYAHLRAGTGGWNDSDLWETLCRGILEQTSPAVQQNPS